MNESFMYLSFVGDEGFLGGCFVQGRDILEAVTEANRLGINPHGEVVGVGPFTDGKQPFEWMPHINRLLSAQDMADLGMEPGPLPEVDS